MTLTFAKQLSTSSRRYQTVSNQLAFWLASACRPLATVEDPEFCKFCKMMYEGYPVPGRHAMGRRIDRLFEAGVKMLRDAMGIEYGLPNLTTDGWTSRS